MPTKAELLAAALGEREVEEGTRATNESLGKLLSLPDKLEPLLSKPTDAKPGASTTEPNQVQKDVDELARAHNATVPLVKEVADRVSKLEGSLTTEATDKGGPNEPGAKGATEGVDTSTETATDPQPEPAATETRPKWGRRAS